MTVVARPRIREAATAAECRNLLPYRRLRAERGIRRHRTIEVVACPVSEARWCYMQPADRPSFTPEMLRELAGMQDGFRAAFAAAERDADAPFRYFVMASRTQGAFSLGGDLALFAERIRARDEATLRRYAHATVRALYNNLQAYGGPVVTVALIQGDALGGGFECALSFDIIVAERTARFGFPEILFNLFPGMGAYSLLSRRIGAGAAERMIVSGRIYSAEELHQMGVIDVLADPGEGERAVRDLIARQRPKHNAHVAIHRARRRVQAVSYEELRDVADVWVAAAMGLTEADLRKMERLCAAQQRRNWQHSVRAGTTG
jgi:DSF synthase